MDLNIRRRYRLFSGKKITKVTAVQQWNQLLGSPSLYVLREGQPLSTRNTLVCMLYVCIKQGLDLLKLKYTFLDIAGIEKHQPKWSFCVSCVFMNFLKINFLSCYYYELNLPFFLKLGNCKEIMFFKECRMLNPSYSVYDYLSMSQKPKWPFSYYHQIGNKVIALFLLGKANKFHRCDEIRLQNYRKMSYIPLTEQSDRQNVMFINSAIIVMLSYFLNLL